MRLAPLGISPSKAHPVPTGSEPTVAHENLQQDILTYRLRACAERRNGNTADGQAWDAEADHLERRLITLQNRGDHGRN